ncbi:MAG: electron transfer flavoprotein subunit alpha/FixB family protein [Anaerolineales bacterium]|nr:electron transfer flavoprotein subunit alpha/FixB family protein [Anaerolineales bacterium]
MDNEIWVWAEHEHGEMRESSMEMLGEAQRLAGKLKAKVCAVLLGDRGAELAGELAAYGAQVVYLFEDERLKEFSVELYMHAFKMLNDRRPPLLVLIASTPNGASLAPRLAARFKCGYAANTVTITVQPDNSIKISRSTLLNKAHAINTYASNTPVVATLKPGSVGLDRPNRTRQAEIVACKLGDAPASRTEAQGVIKADPKVVALDEAERVAAGGNGFREKEDFELLWNLSEVIGAAVGGSKPIFDKGWLPHSRIVGQSSGRRLSPRLFLGVGISGTSYFVEGMKDSRLIVAINSDKGAPLMKLADLAVVGDLYQVLPELTKQIKERQEGKE